MRRGHLISFMFAATLASVGSAEAQTVVIEDDVAPPPVVAPALPAVVPPGPVLAPGLVVVHRRPALVAAPVVVAPRTPLIAAEPVLIAPVGCPYGYGYC